ncbi:MAG: chromate efflux transporter [Candidatus Dormibacteraeota bacterium]|nr:chromate efflux transporter [Candidatus Dormibacteraeota bacterium]
MVFLFLGCVAFGGPAAHVTLMRRLLVQQRHWLDEEQFFELFAACQLIPGPSSTELAVLLGYRRAGWRGLLAAAVSFITPAMGLMLLFAALYQRFGAGPVGQRVLAGVTPVVVGIVGWAVVDLGRRVLRSWDVTVVFAGVAALAVFVNQPIALLAGGGGAIALVRWAGRRAVREPSSGAPVQPAALIAAAGLPTGAASGVAQISAISLAAVFATFLKLGAVAFGSGYVLLVFLRSELVLNLHWLSDRQVVDAIALSQATPGPVFTTATFIGFLVAGVAGAVLATVGIFLPGLALVPLLDRITRVVRDHLMLRDALSGVNVAALGLIVAVAVALARVSFAGAEPPIAAAITLLVMLRWPLSAPALVVAGAIAGGLVA